MQLFICVVLWSVSVVVGQPHKPELPEPDYANVGYGPHERNVFDMWLAETVEPAPLVIYYHGGGFRGGDKRTLRIELLRRLRGNGISVAAVNYRLSATAPYPAQMYDSARALQYIRLHATDYNIDPSRIGATGGSAGAGISQWLAFHDDLADPESPDPVLRQSTRLTAIALHNAQSSYDPRFIKQLMNTDQISEPLIPLFGMKSAADVEDPKFHPLFEDASPINHLSSDDPPVLVYYNQPNDPLPKNSPGDLHIHHPKFGFVLKEKADQVGVECIVLLREDHPDGYPFDKCEKFFLEKFEIEPKSP
jgi:acetyl esterase/lipase